MIDETIIEESGNALYELVESISESVVLLTQIQSGIIFFLGIIFGLLLIKILFDRF